MLEEHAGQLGAVFQALADPTRRAMLRRLVEQELSVGELAAPYAMSFAGASKHVKALERAGLVRPHRAGPPASLPAEPAPLAAAEDWLGFYRRFWGERLDMLERALRKVAQQDNEEQER